MEMTDLKTRASNRSTNLSEVRSKIEAAMPILASEAVACDELGKLTPQVHDILLESGVMRVFQPREYGGMEGDPVEYCRLVMEICAEAPAAGWVAGVVGVHSFEFG